MTKICPACGLHFDENICPNCHLTPGVRLYDTLVSSIEDLGMSPDFRENWFEAAKQLKQTNRALYQDLMAKAGHYLDELNEQTGNINAAKEQHQRLVKKYGLMALREMSHSEFCKACDVTENERRKAEEKT